MTETMTQAMACMYNMEKGQSEKTIGTKPTGDKLYLGKKRPPDVTKGLVGMVNPSLTCCYCRSNGHELNNFNKLQCKIRRELLAAEGIIVEQVLNKKHP